MKSLGSFFSSAHAIIWQVYMTKALLNPYHSGKVVAIDGDTLVVGAYREASSASSGESDNSEPDAGALMSSFAAAVLGLSRHT